MIEERCFKTPLPGLWREHNFTIAPQGVRDQVPSEAEDGYAMNLRCGDNEKIQGFVGHGELIGLESKRPHRKLIDVVS